MKLIKVVLIAVGSCLLLSLAGCGSVTPNAAELRTGDAGAAGAAGGAGGQGGGPTAAGGAAGLAGGQGGAGAGGSDGHDAGCVSEAGVRYCTPSCPPGVPLSGCPVGTVPVNADGTCPIGKTLVAVYAICIPSDAGP